MIGREPQRKFEDDVSLVGHGQCEHALPGSIVDFDTPLDDVPTSLSSRIFKDCRHSILAGVKLNGSAGRHRLDVWR